MKKAKTILYFVSLILLNSCSLFYDMFDDGTFAIGLAKNNAFISVCYWYSGEMSITIPEEYKGRPITELGGYYGRGVPCPFAISLNDKEYNYSSTQPDDDDFETYIFNVIISKNIKKIKLVDGKVYLGINTEIDGNFKSDTLSKIVYHFEVDDENEVFYATEGKLYYKSSRELISDFFYE